MTQQTKDKLINFSSVSEGQNSKGDDRIQLYLKEEDAQDLAVQIASKIKEAQGRGVKLDVHISSKLTKDGQRKFRSAYGFVAAKQEQGKGPFAKKSAVGTGTVKQKYSEDEIQKAIEEMRSRAGAK